MNDTGTTGPADSGWPTGLRRGAVRISRASRRYDETVAFYRDLLALPVLDEFTSSFGEDGTVVGLPGTAVHLEILRDRSRDACAVGRDELVLYLEDVEALGVATSGLRAAGLRPDPEGHPYWEANGAVTYRDPDGRAVVFAPWVYAEVPDPVDRAGAAVVEPDRPPESAQVDHYTGGRDALRALFEEAEDSAVQLDSYIDAGRLLVARLGGVVVGHLQLVETDVDTDIELKSMAVSEHLRGTGIGTRLVDEALSSARAAGFSRMLVATAAADVDNLRFYQRRGFRFRAIERDVFDAAAGYEPGLLVEGIPLRDRVWFDRELDA